VKSAPSLRRGPKSSRSTIFPNAPKVVEGRQHVLPATRRRKPLSWRAGLLALNPQPSTLNLFLSWPTIPVWKWTLWTARRACIRRGSPPLDSAKSGNTPDADNNAKLAAFAQGRSTGKAHGSVSLRHRIGSSPKPKVPQSTVHSCLTAPAKAASVSPRAGKMVLVTIRCSCRTGFEAGVCRTGRGREKSPGATALGALEKN